MKAIRFDFEHQLVEIEEDTGVTNQLCDPELNDKKDGILSAAGLEQVPAEELRQSIDDLLSDLGFNGVKTAK